MMDNTVREASVFVVDDESAFRTGLEKFLSRMQLRVRSFQSGEELLTAIEEDVPNVILLDLQMPGMTGMEVLKALRPKALNTRVIILTAYGAMEDETQARNLGAFDFLIKTIDLEGVEPVINRALKHLLQWPGDSNN